MRRNRPAEAPYFDPLPGHVERDRTMFGKVWDASVPGKRRLVTTNGPVHYRDGNNFEPINLECDPNQDRIRMEFGLYRLSVAKDDVQFRYHSRITGTLRCKLVEIGGVPVAQAGNVNLVPTVHEEGVRWQNIIDGLGFRIELWPRKAKLIMRCGNLNTPRRLKFQCEEDDVAEFRANWERVTAFDARGLRVKTLIRIEDLPAPQGTHLYTVELRIFPQVWIAIDPAVRNSGEWFDGAEFPLTLDPDIEESVAAGADDGHLSVNTKDGTNWIGSATTFIAGYDSGKSAYQYFASVRWQTIAVAQADTIDLANMRLQCTTAASGADNDWYGDDRDDAPVPSRYSCKGDGTDWTDTTAYTHLDGPASTGEFTVTVTDVIQELVDRGGWSSGNDVRLGSIYSDTDDHQISIASYDHSTETEPVLEIDFTAAGAGFVPYPNPRYALSGGMQDMDGGV